MTSSKLEVFQNMHETSIILARPPARSACVSGPRPAQYELLLMERPIDPARPGVAMLEFITEARHVRENVFGAVIRSLQFCTNLHYDQLPCLPDTVRAELLCPKHFRGGLRSALLYLLVNRVDALQMRDCLPVTAYGGPVRAINRVPCTEPASTEPAAFPSRRDPSDLRPRLVWCSVDFLESNGHLFNYGPILAWFVNYRRMATLLSRRGGFVAGKYTIKDVVRYVYQPFEARVERLGRLSDEQQQHIHSVDWSLYAYSSSDKTLAAATPVVAVAVVAAPVSPTAADAAAPVPAPPAPPAPPVVVAPLVSPRAAALLAAFAPSKQQQQQQSSPRSPRSPFANSNSSPRVTPRTGNTNNNSIAAAKYTKKNRVIIAIMTNDGNDNDPSVLLKRYIKSSTTGSLLGMVVADNSDNLEQNIRHFLHREFGFTYTGAFTTDPEHTVCRLLISRAESVRYFGRPSAAEAFVDATIPNRHDITQGHYHFDAANHRFAWQWWKLKHLSHLTSLQFKIQNLMKTNGVTEDQALEMIKCGSQFLGRPITEFRRSKELQQFHKLRLVEFTRPWCSGTTGFAPEVGFSAAAVAQHEHTDVVKPPLPPSACLRWDNMVHWPGHVKPEELQRLVVMPPLRKVIIQRPRPVIDPILFF